MARPRSTKKLREETKESLEKSIQDSGMKEKYYMDKVDEYMSFYDDLTTINEQLTSMKLGDYFNLKSYTDAVSEKRRISNEMRSILSFLGLKPLDGKSGGRV